MDSFSLSLVDGDLTILSFLTFPRKGGGGGHLFRVEGDKVYFSDLMLT